MAELAGFDWPGYVGSLQDAEARALACWLAKEGLRMGEFVEIIDRAYAAAPASWQGRWQHFMLRVGRPAAEGYACRKHGFIRLMALLEQALMSGALPGEVAPQELDLAVLPRPEQPQVQVEELLGALARLRRGRD
jgi:hypothetical protein